MDKVLNIFGLKRTLISKEIDNEMKNISVKDFGFDKKFKVDDDDLSYFMMFGPDDDEQYYFEYLLFEEKYHWNKIKFNSNCFILSFISFNILLISLFLIMHNILLLAMCFAFLSTLFFKKRISKRIGDFRLSRSIHEMIKEADIKQKTNY